MKTHENLDEIGLSVDKNGSLEINYNSFCRYYLAHKKLIFCTTDKQFYEYRQGIYKICSPIEISTEIRETLNTLLEDCWQPGYEQQILRTLRLEVNHVEEFNRSTQKLCLENGIFDTRNYILKGHSCKAMFSMKLPIAFEENADCPQFKHFLQEIFNFDKKSIALVQEFFGYSLTKSTKAEKSLMLFGNGANGKSVLLHVLTNLLGKENISNIPLSALKESFRILGLKDKYLNIIAEGGFKAQSFSAEEFKSVISGDYCGGQIKFGPEVSFKPFCKLVFSVNRLPHITDTSYGLERRLIILVFPRIFRESEQNKSLKYKLLKELPGIFNFSLEGLQRLRENNYNFTIPDNSKKIMREFFSINNPVREFVETQIQPDANGRTTYKKLSESYLCWLRNEGIPQPINFNRRIFNNDVKAVLNTLGINYKLGGKSDDSRRLDGVSLRQQQYLSYN